MIQCSVCGAVIRHEWNGHFNQEAGTFICNGCYAPELHPDQDEYDWLLDGGPEPFEHDEDGHA